MKQRLPSLLAIRYFEAVGRNLSFTLAANELNVTQAAVSHQVRLLEQELDVKLFTRLHQRIELTEKGLELLEVSAECFEKLADVTNSISKGKRTSRIHLSVSPLISTHVLMARIGEFLDAEKDTEVIIHHSLAPPNEREAPYDIKIFFSRTIISNESFEFVLQDKLIPMCIPALWRKNKGESPGNFLKQTGVVHEFDYQWWESWCEQTGVDKNIVRRGLALDDPSVLLNAALLGRGVILGSKRFLADRLRAGELIAPMGEQDGVDIYYYLCTNKTQRRRDITKLSAWLRSAITDLRHE
ncbi:LysR family transcriptional regulator [Paracoccus sp. AK26]|uniref:LysR family transcriptional regulator n=1 Tax=Paracoccus sp. AK26 TaxID=2589076 RepID=UPI00142FCB28|nr:LysR family transcriptional regulator [Paracoccus sp. AK26]